MRLPLRNHVVDAPQICAEELHEVPIKLRTEACGGVRKVSSGEKDFRQRNDGKSPIAIENVASLGNCVAWLSELASYWN